MWIPAKTKNALFGYSLLGRPSDGLESYTSCFVTLVPARLSLAIGEQRWMTMHARYAQSVMLITHVDVCPHSLLLAVSRLYRVCVWNGVGCSNPFRGFVPCASSTGRRPSKYGGSLTFESQGEW
jgi:hypothetical protein